MRKNQIEITEVKDTLTELKNSIGGVNIRLDEEVRIQELKKRV